MVNKKKQLNQNQETNNKWVYTMRPMNRWLRVTLCSCRRHYCCCCGFFGFPTRFANSTHWSSGWLFSKEDQTIKSVENINRKEKSIFCQCATNWSIWKWIRIANTLCLIGMIWTHCLADYKNASGFVFSSFDDAICVNETNFWTADTSKMSKTKPSEEEINGKENEHKTYPIYEKQ